VSHLQFELLVYRVATTASGLIVALVLAPAAVAANWSVSRVNHTVLTPPGGVTVAEMSGVTYVGPVGGLHRFIAAEETHGELLQFDVSFTAVGGISAVSNITALPISYTQDFEGIAYTNPTRNSVFLSHENGPGVREVSLATGAGSQTVTVPSVFTAPGNKRPNLGFESLTRTLDGTAMWTANEQALTVDGPEATSSAGTPIRLLKMNVAGNSVSVGPQYAYHVEPIHGSSSFGSPQSGLSDLAAMPDGTLLALERSVAFLASPSTYLNRIYEIDFDAATDVSLGPTAGGLIGQSYTPVSKSLVWSGPADGGSGQNMEGFALGPQLANGSWVLLGVVDNGDGFSGNTIVAFTATANPSADFDEDGDVDGADFLAWQRGVATTVGADLAEGDADRDGGVDGADLSIWEEQFTSASVTGAAVPEPSAAALLLLAVVLQFTRRRNLWLKAESQ
jgi:hypothetical protein